MSSRRTRRATNISTNERSSPTVNNITDQGLATITLDNKPAIETSNITMPSLQAGDFFEKDIEYITSVINDVEKQFSEKTLN